MGEAIRHSYVNSTRAVGLKSQVLSSMIQRSIRTFIESQWSKAVCSTISMCHPKGKRRRGDPTAVVMFDECPELGCSPK